MSFLSNLPSSDFLLQDGVVHQLLTSKKISARERGTKFPDDFTNKGDIIITRKPRGKTAKIEVPESQIYASYKRGNSVTVPLWGDEGELAYWAVTMVVRLVGGHVFSKNVVDMRESWPLGRIWRW